MRGTLPPQAYTREILSQAYNWLQGQPESIRQLARDTDSLVGLFLRARRNGVASLETEAPKSTEDFRQNLKSLATELKQFSGAEVARDSIVEPMDTMELTRTSSRPTQSSAAPPPPSSLFAPEKAVPPVKEAHHPSPSPSFALEHLDQRTRDTLTRVRNILNVSSEHEALRVLVTLGYERLQGFLNPKGPT